MKTPVLLATAALLLVTATGCGNDKTAGEAAPTATGSPSAATSPSASEASPSAAATTTTPAPRPTLKPNDGQETKYSRTMELAMDVFVQSNAASAELQQAQPTDAPGTNAVLKLSESSPAWFAEFDQTALITCIKTEEGTYFAFKGVDVANGRGIAIIIGDGDCNYEKKSAQVYAMIDPGAPGDKWEKGGELMSTYNPGDVFYPAG